MKPLPFTYEPEDAPSTAAIRRKNAQLSNILTLAVILSVSAAFTAMIFTIIYIVTTTWRDGIIFSELMPRIFLTCALIGITHFIRNYIPEYREKTPPLDVDGLARLVQIAQEFPAIKIAVKDWMTKGYELTVRDLGACEEYSRKEILKRRSKETADHLKALMSEASKD